MSLSVSSLTSAGHSGTATSPATASVSPAGNSFLVLWVSYFSASFTISSVSGLSLTWTHQKSEADGASTNSQLECWTAPCGASPGSGAITINFGGLVNVIAWDVDQVTGQNTSTPLVTSNTQANNGNSSSLSVSYNALGSSNNLLLFAGEQYNSASSATPALTANESPSAWTQLAQVNGTNGSSGSSARRNALQTQVSPSSPGTTGSASSTLSLGWAAIGLELNAAAAAGVAGTVQPQATVPVPRRRPGRGLWQKITGQAYAAVPAPRQQPGPAPRRKPARAVWHGITGAAYVKVPAPRQQPAPAPRPKPARALVRFTPVRTTNATPATPVSGTVQPRATVPARSRRPARALVLFTRPAPPLVPSGTVQSRATLVTARRRPARAVIPVPAVPFAPLVPVTTEGGAVYYPYHHRGRGRTR